MQNNGVKSYQTWRTLRLDKNVTRLKCICREVSSYVGRLSVWKVGGSADIGRWKYICREVKCICREVKWVEVQI